MCKNDDTNRTDVSNDSLVEGAGKITLEKANMWGRGILSDVRTTVGTHWRSEVTNFNQKTVAVTFLLFISVIAPTLTFGAVYGKITENNIGAIETIMGSAWVGIAYALVGGMPIVSFHNKRSHRQLMCLVELQTFTLNSLGLYNSGFQSIQVVGCPLPPLQCMGQHLALHLRCIGSLFRRYALRAPCDPLHR
jgi:hypothetical protein